MKFKFKVTLEREGAVIAASEKEALEIVTSTFARTFENGAKISKLIQVPHRIPEGVCPKQK